jgi:hypothetical protein
MLLFYMYVVVFLNPFWNIYFPDVCISVSEYVLKDFVKNLKYLQ